MTCSGHEWAVSDTDCRQCGAIGTVEPHYIRQEFPYGVGDEAVTLRADVVVFRCSECDDAYTDWTAECARDAAVELHLKSRRS